MTAWDIIGVTAVIIILLVIRDFCKFQRAYYSRRVRVRTPWSNRAKTRAADKKKRKRERQQRREARRRK